MVMAAMPATRVLARLRGVTQELTVGIASATATVRTLSDVSLEVRERELVVLSGSPGAGERALIAVLAGDRRGVTGECETKPDIRVRLLRIGARAAIALIHEWQRCDMLAYCAAMRDSLENAGEIPHPEIRRNAELHATMQQVPAGAAPDLILLDVVADTPTDAPVRAPQLRVAESRPAGMPPWDERNRAALTAWAGVCRMRGGAVVMAAGDAIGVDLLDAALLRVQNGARRRSFRSLTPLAFGGLGPAGPAGAISPETPSAAVRETFTEGAGVRVVPMHCGRVGPSVRLGRHEWPS